MNPAWHLARVPGQTGLRANRVTGVSSLNSARGFAPRALFHGAGRG